MFGCWFVSVLSSDLSVDVHASIAYPSTHLDLLATRLFQLRVAPFSTPCRVVNVQLSADMVRATKKLSLKQSCTYSPGGTKHHSTRTGDPRYRLCVSVAGKDGRSIIDVYKRQGTAQVDVEYVVCEAAARFSERIEFHGFTIPQAAEWARTQSAHRATELKFEYARLCRDAAQIDDEGY